MKRFFSSLLAYLILYKAGFWISRTKTEAVEMNRFFWKNKQIHDMADIDHSYRKEENIHVYTTLLNGTVRRLW